MSTILPQFKLRLRFGLRTYIQDGASTSPCRQGHNMFLIDPRCSLPILRHCLSSCVDTYPCCKSCVLCIAKEILGKSYAQAATHIGEGFAAC